MTNDEWAPLDEIESAIQIEALLDVARARGWKRVVDLGCGSGRVAIPLAEEGIRVLAIDRDPQALDALVASAAAGVRERVERRPGDFFDDTTSLSFESGERADAAILVGNTLMEIHDVDRAAALFRRLRERLAPGGVVVVDNSPFDTWADVAEGVWQEGVSDDGEWQMLWADGDCVVAIRRGEDVDAENWEVRESDRRFRLWSYGALRLLALASGWDGPRQDPTGALLVFGTT